MPVLYTYLQLYCKEPPEVPVYDAYGEIVKKMKLPWFFGFPIRKDLIRRAFLAAFTSRIQPQGRDPYAGKRTTARSFGVGLGIARVPRIPGIGRAAFINSAVGGMAAHPPRVEKRTKEEINKKEKRIALLSALASTSIPEMVRARGHRFSVEHLPVILSNGVEDDILYTTNARELLKKIGLWEDVERSKKGTRIRAGKGKMRGRRYKEPKSILFILSDASSNLALAVRNLPGVDIMTPKTLNILLLAPGGVPGRLTVITENALEMLTKMFSEGASP